MGSKRLKHFNEVQIMRNGMEKVIGTNGSVQVSLKELQVGQRCTIQIIYTVGKDKIYPGGVIRFTIPFGFTRPQIEMPLKPGYTTAFTEKLGTKVTTKLVKSKWWKRGPDRTKIENVSEHVGTHVWVMVTGSTLVEGDKVILTYGDTSYSDFGAGYACLTTGPVQFDVATDQTGRLEAPYSGFYLTENPPTVMMNPCKANHYEVILQSDIVLGEKYKVHVFARDKYYNLDYFYQGKAVLFVNGAKSEEIVFDKNDCGIKTVYLNATEKGTIVVEAKAIDSDLTGKSNPGITHEKRPNEVHYWGDLHGHSGIQWGRGSGRAYYEYAKEVANLDFCALTDPDAGRYTDNNKTAIKSVSCYMSDEEWESIQKVNKQFYSEGEFVPILGYEYHNDAPGPEFGGDRNVYFDNYDQDILRCVDEGSYTPSELWETMRKNNINAITIPHHTAKKVMPGNWNIHDEEFQPLVEIYSSWGSSECYGCERPIIGGADYEKLSVQHALNKGYRLGFVAGSDTHAGNPGYAHWVFSEHVNSYRGGLTCVITDELSLPSIFSALQKRKVYATTGERIILDFTLNNAQMGEEIPYKENKRRTLEVEVYGTDKIDRIDIISMGNVVFSYKGEGANAKFQWIDNSYLSDGWTYYYVRVIQKDKAMAWSSPIWLS
jgi:hypothetical protein